MSLSNYHSSSAPCSLDNHVEEFVPIGGLKPRETHREPLYLLYYVVFDIQVVNPAFISVRCQVYLQEALFNEVVKVVVVAQLYTTQLVLSLELAQLLTLLC